MSALKTVWDYFTQPRTISGVKNYYYMSDPSGEKSKRFPRPAEIHTVFAKKTLTGSWSLYEITHRPMRPVAHIGTKGGGMITIDDRWGSPEKITGGLDGKEAFDRVRDHELHPPSWGYDKKTAQHIGIGRKLLLEQKRPDTPTYWRNLEI